MSTKLKRKIKRCSHQTSYNEQALYYYISKMYPDAQSRAKIAGVEADIHIASKHVALEYDGERWHTVEKIAKDVSKYHHMKKHNLTLIRVREPNCPDLPDYPGKVLRMKGLKNADVNAIILETLQYLCSINPSAVFPDVDIERDAHEISALISIKDYENSLMFRYPEIAQEWDYEKNYPLTPDMIAAGSPKKVWWKCPLGHSYHTDPHHRIAGRGCSICAGRVVLVGFNDLESQNPELVQYWNYEKNQNISPSEITSASHRRVWWKCACGKEFQARIQDATGKCHTCSANKVTHGENDLATVRPDLLKYWDYTANTIKPNQIKCTSLKHVHWICPECGYKYTRSVLSQCEAKGLCPACSRSVVVKGVNDFATTHPEIASWWHETKNLKAASEVLSGSAGVWWWKCPKGHEFQREMRHQLQNCTCPDCKQERYQVYAINITDFQDTRVFQSGADAAQYLQRARHGIVEAIRDKRPINGYLCSYHDFISEEECRAILEQWKYKPDSRNQKVACVRFEESLAGQHPSLLKEWDFDKNGTLDPSQIRSTTKQSVWWKCSRCGGSWRTRVVQRTSRGMGDCPHCRAKPVYAVSILDFADQKRFASAKIAATETGAHYKNIMHCCKYAGHMTNGYLWSHQPFDDEAHYKTLLSAIPQNQITVAKRRLGLRPAN